MLLDELDELEELEEFIVLDELAVFVTAGLDVLTEKLLTAAMVTFKQHATVITVNHRFESIQHANTLYIIENGQVSASGTHAQLASHPFYQSMKKRGTLDESTHSDDLG